MFNPFSHLWAEARHEAADDPPLEHQPRAQLGNGRKAVKP